MIEFVILMLFWHPDGELKMQYRHGFASAEHCRTALPTDVEMFRKLFGQAEGFCIHSPPKPEGLPEPKPIKKQIET